MILFACEAKAREIGVNMDIAVTDDSGTLIAFQCMDNARITSIKHLDRKGLDCRGCAQGDP
jgi:uncharacterized protein GlcG (DUF336 family)